ncbi:hypothetical protein VPH35_065628 [Triticum aestivum]
MARLPLATTRSRRRNLAFRNISISIMLMYYYIWLLFALVYKRRLWKIEKRIRNRELRAAHLYQLIGESDVACIQELRMDRRTFHKLCEIVRVTGGLEGTRNTSLEEIKFFYRRGETISRNFNKCLLAVLKLHNLLLKKPEPIPKDCTDNNWKYFKVNYLCMKILVSVR